MNSSTGTAVDGGSAVAEGSSTAELDRGNPLPPWWGWPGGQWRDGLPGTVGPNGFKVPTGTDVLLHRGITARDEVWINPDRPAQPDEVVLARFADGHRVLGVWYRPSPASADHLRPRGRPRGATPTWPARG